MVTVSRLYRKEVKTISYTVTCPIQLRPYAVTVLCLTEYL